VRLIDRPTVGVARKADAPSGIPSYRVRPTSLRRRRRRWLYAALASFSVLLVIVAGAYIGYRQVRAATDRLQGDVTREFAAGQTELEAGKSLLKKANTDRSATELAQAKAHFNAALPHFAAVRGRVDQSRLLRLAERLPFVAASVKAKHATAAHLSDMGTDLARVALDAAEVDALLISPPGTAHGGARLLAVLHDVEPLLLPLKADLAAAQAASEQADPQALTPRERAVLTDARATIASGLSGIDAIQNLAPALVDVLGGNGQRTYLMEQVNPSELRSGGGFMGTVSILTADKGSLSLAFSGDVQSFNVNRALRGHPGYVPPPNTLTGFYQGLSWYFADTNFFPDFGSNAKWAQYFAEQKRGIKTDGVFAVDYYAVAAMLQITGPIAVPEFRVTLTSSNLVAEVVKRDTGNNFVHKPIIAAAAQTLVDRISNLPPDKWPALISLLNSAVAGRHIQVAFNRPVVDSAMQSFGWSGALNPQKAGDFMMETEDNMGGTKVNYYLTRHYTVDLISNGQVLHHRVAVDLQDNTPSTAFYGGNYYTYVRLYVGDTATKLTMRKDTTEYRATIPADYANHDIPAGYKLADGWIFITIGRHHSGHFRLIFEYDTQWTTDASGRHTIYWQKQPGVAGDQIDLAFSIDGSTFKARTALNQDQLLTLSSNGITIGPGQLATAHLPGLSL
jgi:hypothetical protein